jgi:hypothetical protein
MGPPLCVHDGRYGHPKTVGSAQILPAGLYKGFASCPNDPRRVQVSATREHHTYDGSVSFRVERFNSTIRFIAYINNESVQQRNNKNPKSGFCNMQLEKKNSSKGSSEASQSKKLRDQNAFHAARTTRDATSFCQCTYPIVLTLPGCLGCFVVHFNADLHCQLVHGDLGVAHRPQSDK